MSIILRDHHLYRQVLATLVMPLKEIIGNAKMKISSLAYLILFVIITHGRLTGSDLSLFVIADTIIHIEPL